jgi:hypothetical protein
MRHFKSEPLANNHMPTRPASLIHLLLNILCGRLHASTLNLKYLVISRIALDGGNAHINGFDTELLDHVADFDESVVKVLAGGVGVFVAGCSEVLLAAGCIHL